MRTLQSTLLVFLIGAIGAACSSQAQAPPPPEQQIQAAVQAAPEALRDSAAVLGYAEDGTLTTLREGHNAIICLADDPGDDRFHVACYHESLEPFMKVGRELRAQGYSGAAVDSVRQVRIEAGELSMPDRPAALYSLSGPADSFNPETGEITDAASPLYVVYAPFETGETTGLPTRPKGNRPWLMEAGTPWAHIMYSPGTGN